MAIKSKPKAKPMPAKKAAPPARKPEPKKAVPAKRAAPAAEVPPSDLADVLSNTPTGDIADTLLAEVTQRINYVVENTGEGAEDLADLWVHIKRIEQHMINVRRALDDALCLVYEADEDAEGSEEHELEGFTIKILRKLTRSVDADALTQLSEEYEVDDEIARLFRFKPELNLAAFRAESEELQELFAAVITTKPARPSITITATEE